MYGRRDCVAGFSCRTAAGSPPCRTGISTFITGVVADLCGIFGGGETVAAWRTLGGAGVVVRAGLGTVADIADYAVFCGRWRTGVPAGLTSALLAKGV